MTTSLRQALLVSLALVSGATDAIGFVGLGGAFTSVMTGNMVLLGISAGHHDGALALRSGLAIVLFMVGCGLGTRLAGSSTTTDPLWPRAVSRALWVEAFAFLLFACGWWAAGSAPHGSWQLTLLSINAVALGIQSAAVLRFNISGMSTTYMTGTLTTLVAKLAMGQHPRNVLASAQIIAALIGGAVFAALLVLHEPALAPLLQLVPLLAVLVIARLRGHVPIDAEASPVSAG